MMHHLHWICIVHLVVFATMGAGITYRKGRGPWLGAFWGCFLGIFGVIAMIFVKRGAQVPEEAELNPSPQSPPTDNYGRAKL